MIKIAIDTSSISEKYGIRGVGFYTQRLMEAFKKIPHDGIIIEPLELRRLSQEDLNQYSLIHYPYFDPFFLTLPINKIKPAIVTVHDLIPLKFSNHFPKGVKGWFKWQVQKFSLKGSSAIITDSKTSKNDIMEITGINENLIYTIYLAADEEFKPMTQKKLKQIFQKYHLPESFILYVGDLNWNKNIPGLIRAFKGIHDQKKDLFLVVVGKAFLNKDLTERIAISRLIKDLKIEKQVIFLGFIPTKDLAALYNLAVCYCQPSFYEGFGLPVLEAMVCGCPVVCSQTSSLKEITGSATILVNPHNHLDIRNGLKKIIENKELKNKLIKIGFRQIKKFSWIKTAKETLKVYQTINNDIN